MIIKYGFELGGLENYFVYNILVVDFLKGLNIFYFFS